MLQKYHLRNSKNQMKPQKNLTELFKRNKGKSNWLCCRYLSKLIRGLKNGK